MHKVGQIEKEKRIYEISLLLRSKPKSFICRYMSEKWSIGERQAERYIRLARKEWAKYFEKLEGDGIAYHIAEMRDLKDTAYDKGDYRLVFDIAKEEAKLMGIYPKGEKV